MTDREEEILRSKLVDVTIQKQKLERIIANYETMHVQKTTEKEEQPTLFIKELVFIFDPLLSLFEVSARRNIHPNYAIEKLKSIKGQIDYTLGYFNTLKSEMEKEENK